MSRTSALVTALPCLLTALVPARGTAPPATAPAGRPAVAADTALVLVDRVQHLDTMAAEPMLAELPDGTLFVAGYGGPLPEDPADAPRVVPFWRARLWRSADGGATWSRVEPGPEAAGAIGNSDVDLAVGPDGTLWFASMTFQRLAGEGLQIAVGASHDAGASWSWSVVSKRRLDDRPWIAVAPDGAAHLIWNDGA
ncbi:MAG TPA: sialidase family protein, partial [Gemmatimonadota bacterium]|nr:sialidase family protein [Gemmatimonadota bacterium]